MAKKQFKSESKRLLDLMVNSIYTHKEIFLRELISNASDAIDKLCYISLTDDKVGLTRDDFRITVDADREKRTLTVSDNGVGMTAEELESNLGVIARSGSLQFKRDMDEKPENVDIIGQFGVGFYSAFMVAARVTVVSRAYGEDTAHKWVSEGSDGYTVAPCEKESPGTDVIMELKPDTEDERYGEYLEEYALHSLVKKYSDYIRWPIVMDVTKSRRVEGEPDKDGKPVVSWEDYAERETVNSRVPIWQRAKGEATDEDCAGFYKEQFSDMDDPLSVVRVSAEGAVSYKAMLFIPASAPTNYFTREFDAGLKLYASGVLIMERCAALLPEYFRFARGVVDSPDLSLNISRELLQHDRQLKIIAANIEKKLKAELTRLQADAPEKYETFYKNFGIQLKYGILADYGANRDSLKDLLMFWSPRAGKLITVAEYVKNMPEGQPFIYFACGENAAALDKLPQAEPVRDKGYDVLYLTDDVDEFVVRTLDKFDEKEFRSVTSDDLGLQSDDEKQETEKIETENQGALDFIKEALAGKIAAARISRKLKSHPVCLATQGGVTLEMERYFNSVQGNPGAPVVAERVLELNAAHPVFQSLTDAFEADKEKCARYAELLYGQALLIAGVPIEDPVRFAELICELM
ncbi:MAG: molecular chaperone HtpG [Oscillospiraceae bacterium]|jgi:molecular chaperone HtpG|nr:molecular chaperone HtpG [Oscillospiraceae bacterium]